MPNMKKTVTTLMLLALVWASTMALPAWRKAKTCVQPDGTAIELFLRGDESLHYLALESGQPVARDAEGYYCYAQVEDGDRKSVV